MKIIIIAIVILTIFNFWCWRTQIEINNHILLNKQHIEFILKHIAEELKNK